MATTEHTINDALAEALRNTRRQWRKPNIVRSENLGLLAGSSKRPDILIAEPNVSPVVIEVEVAPALTVEKEAYDRLGQSLKATGRPILSSIALKVPIRLRGLASADLMEAITKAPDLEVALFTGATPAECTRWPAVGWIKGTVDDVSIIAQSATIPPAVINEAAGWLVDGVSEAAGLLGEVAATNPGVMTKICEELKQEDNLQTRGMAMTIVANAFVFHDHLVGGSGALAQIRSIDELRPSGGPIPKGDLLTEWNNILKVNYWPIFDIARRILEMIPVQLGSPLLEKLAATANKLLSSGLTQSHDLTGAVFQKLIADRKFLAAYYTTPGAAALLAGLAIDPNAPPAGGSWADPKKILELRVADFACGTGTLLSAAYQRIGQLHELAGGDAEAIHAQMMAKAVVGCDILPAAAHLTASMLSGTHPTAEYQSSSIMTVAYGKQPSGDVALGSLDLLDPQGTFAVLAITARAAEALGETEKETWAALPHASFDIVLMNPPFTRATGHEASKIGVPNPMFAAFSNTEEEQRAMSRATQRLTRGTSAHGNAGEASIFLVLADRKLKPRGVVALVMPLSLMAGDAWEESRQLLRNSYRNLIAISISGSGDADVSFSADTDMGECLVVAEKNGGESKRATFVVLKQRPAFPMIGAAMARQVRDVIKDGQLRRLEEGPVGGTPIYFGADAVGHAIEAPLAEKGPWSLSRIADLSLAQAAYQLEHGVMWLPGISKQDAKELPITTVSAVGQVGPYHADINGTTQTGGIRGPFTVRKIPPGTVPTDPILWSHLADRERAMRFEAESEGLVRKGKNAQESAAIGEKTDGVRQSASHCHFNRDFRFNSQSTCMQFTPRKTIGGRAWPSIKLATEEQEKALVLWANSSFGLLLYWWRANKQHAGRGSIGVSALRVFPVLDVTALSKSRLTSASQIFDDLATAELRPLNEIDVDANRAILDARVATEVLGLPPSAVVSGGPVELLRLKLAKEPSVFGGKKS